MQTACSTKPVYYSEKQVKHYVADVYGEDWELTETIEEHEYQFTNDSGLTFTVYADNERPISMDGASASIYVKVIRDNYFEAIYEQHRDEINALTEEQGFSIINQLRSGRMYLLINSTEDLEAAAKVITAIDALLGYQCNYRKTGLRLAKIMEKKITCVLTLKPEEFRSSSGEYWYLNEKNHVCEIPFSNRDKKRLSEKKCLKIINRSVS